MMIDAARVVHRSSAHRCFVCAALEAVDWQPRGGVCRSSGVGLRAGDSDQHPRANLVWPSSADVTDGRDPATSGLQVHVQV